MRFVSVVISTRSLSCTRVVISDSTSSTCVPAGRISTSGSTRPVGPHDLLHDLIRVRVLVRARRCGHEHRLRRDLLVLLERQAADCRAPTASESRTRRAFPCASDRLCTCRRSAESSRGSRRRTASASSRQVVEQARRRLAGLRVPTDSASSSRCRCSSRPRGSSPDRSACAARAAALRRACSRRASARAACRDRRESDRRHASSVSRGVT